MKITDLTTHFMNVERQNWLFVRVQTDEGLHGWGEASVEGQEKAVAEAIHAVGPRIIGEDPTRIEYLWQMLYRQGFWRGGPVLNSALAGIDQALWDVTGKAYGVPVYKLLGGPVRDRIRAYTHTRSVKQAVALVKEGFTAIKTNSWPYGNIFDPAKAVSFLHDYIGSLREAVGPGIDLMVDNLGRTWPSLVIRQIEVVEEFGLLFFEEPTGPENLDLLAQLRRVPFRVDLATGERLYSRWDYKELIERQLVDIIQPDVCHCGGISELRRIAAAAETYYIRVAPHNPNGPVATAANVQLAAAIPNFAILEYSHLVSEHPEVQKTGPVLTDGYFDLPTAPGLGIELDMDVIERNPYVNRQYQGVFYPDGAPADGHGTSDPRYAGKNEIT